MKKICRICDGQLSSNILIAIKKAPASAQNFSKFKSKKSQINLIAKECTYCGCVQLINKPVDYYKNVIRAVKFSPSMMKFRSQQLKKFVKKFNLKKKLAIEVGCGGGDYLKILSRYIDSVYGLEYSKKNCIIAKKNNLKIIRGFINNKNTKIYDKKFNAFFIFSYLEHIPNINQFLEGLYKNLDNKAVGIIEVPNFEMILKKNLYSEFIIDHIFYFTKVSLEFLLKKNNFKILSSNFLWKKYILSIVVQKVQENNNLLKKIKKRNLKFNYKSNILKVKKSFLNFINKYSKNNKIAVWGAGHQSLTLLSLVGLEKKIKYIVDSASFKQNKYAPGTNLKVVSPKEFLNDNIDAVIVIAAGYNDEICKIIKKYKKKICIAKFNNNNLQKY